MLFIIFINQIILSIFRIFTLVLLLRFLRFLRDFILFRLLVPRSVTHLLSALVGSDSSAELEFQRLLAALCIPLQLEFFSVVIQQGNRPSFHHLLFVSKFLYFFPAGLKRVEGLHSNSLVEIFRNFLLVR